MTLPPVENWMHSAAAQWAGWMRESLVSGLLALGLAAALSLLFRRRSAPGFLCVVWLLVLVRVAAPVNVHIPVPLPAALSRPAVSAPAASVPAAATAARGDSVDVENDTVPTDRGVPWRAALFSLWSAGALAGLLRLAHQARRARRMAQDATPATRDECPVDLAALAAETGLRRAPEARVSDALTSPAVTGLWSPVLLLPRGLADTLTPGQFRWAMAHELSHLRRGDLWVQVFESVIKCLFFFHPAVWIASRQLAARREDCCDAAASALTGLPARESAAGLLSLWERARPAPAAALGMSGDHRLARQRMRRMLAGGLRGKHALFPWTAAAMVPAAAVLSLGAVRPADGSQDDLRIRALESRIAELEGKLQSKTRRETLREQAQAAAALRATRDQDRYSADELHEIEIIYQAAKKLPDFPSMIPALQPLFDRFPESNRAGCAALFLGRRLEGTERHRLLTWAADSAVDCLFLDGTSVGGLARILLARDALASGQTEEAAHRLREARDGYADGIDFEGAAIADLADALSKELP